MTVRTLAIVAAIIPMLVAALLIYAATRPGTFRVQRAMRTKVPPGLFVNIGSMIGRDFETGLANLETLAER